MGVGYDPDELVPLVSAGRTPCGCGRVSDVIVSQSTGSWDAIWASCAWCVPTIFRGSLVAAWDGGWLIDRRDAIRVGLPGVSPDEVDRRFVAAFMEHARRERPAASPRSEDDALVRWRRPMRQADAWSLSVLHADVDPAVIVEYLRRRAPYPQGHAHDSLS